MARPHHRKKHKEHLRQFKHDHDGTASSSSTKGNSTGLFSIIGAVTGFGISYFAAGLSVLWLSIGILAGAVIGFYIGRRIDNDK